MKVSPPFGHEGRATLVIAVGVIIYVGFIIGGKPWWASALAGFAGSAIVFLLCKWHRMRKYMLSVDAPVWFTKEQLGECSATSPSSSLSPSPEDEAEAEPGMR